LIKTLEFRMKFSVLVLACLLGTALTIDEGNDLDISTNTSAMEDVFLRSEDVHSNSMDAIMKTMSVANAVEVLQKSNLATPALMQASNMALGRQSNLRKQPKGYGGLDSARKLLNDMIFEAMSKYDAEIAKCTDYYSKQCAALNTARGQIAAANYVAANSRTLILVSQSTISRCEVDIPTKKAGPCGASQKVRQ